MSRIQPNIVVGVMKHKKNVAGARTGVGAGGGPGAGSKIEAPGATAASSSSTSSQNPSFIRRYRFVWPALLGLNLVVGGYVLLRTKPKHANLDEAKERVQYAETETVSQPISSATSTSVIPVASWPISEDEQRQLFKWILEERRQIKAANPSEKSRIDEEKAILKQYITSKEIRNF